jgi:hypothetical protein
MADMIWGAQFSRVDGQPTHLSRITPYPIIWSVVVTAEFWSPNGVCFWYPADDEHPSAARMLSFHVAGHLQPSPRCIMIPTYIKHREVWCEQWSYYKRGQREPLLDFKVRME